MTAATLQMLLDEGIGLYYRCRCGHSDVLDGATLNAVLGGDRPISVMPVYIMCRQCGNRSVEVQPDWPSPGRIVEPMP